MFCVSASLYIVVCILNVCYVCVVVCGMGSIGLFTMIVMPACLFMCAYLEFCVYVYVFVSLYILVCILNVCHVYCCNCLYDYQYTYR